MDPGNEELLKDFFEEAQMQVETLEQNIIVLENDPDNRDSIDEIFRAVHTLKGGAATVEMSELAEFTHIIEDVLDEIRSHKLRVNEEVVDILLKAIDITRAMVEERASGGVFKENISGLVDSLNALLSEEEMQASVDAQKKSKTGDSPVLLSEYEMLELLSTAEEEYPIYRIRVTFNEDNPMNTVGGVQVYALLNKAGKVLKSDPEIDKLYEDNFYPIIDYFIATEKTEQELKELLNITDVVLNSEIVSIKEAEEAESTTETRKPKIEETGIEQMAVPEQAEIAEAQERKSIEKAKEKSFKKKKASAYGSVLRVDSRRIDDLLNLVSEAVILKANFNQLSSRFAGNLDDLQSAEMRYREQIKEITDSFPKIVEQLENGDSFKSIRKTFQERVDGVYEIFDMFSGSLKSIVAQFESTAQSLVRVTGELQEGVMKIRMVPIAQIFSRFPRLLRDLTRSLNKDINLVIEGEDTELDKSVIEDILDPLIHCVRNAIDHGIELPDEREKAGKDPKGKIRLAARNEGNMIVITVSDDGRGIDVESIRKSAINLGLIHPNKALTDVEAFNLIFEPGFSTADRITNISGRGVGLDVVRKQLEKLNGSVSIWSEPGKGSVFTIKLPLTLAIIQGLMVRVGKEIYAIPIASVIESLRIRPSEVKLIDHYEVFNLRDDVLSLLRMDRLFKIESEEKKPFYFVVVVGSGEKKVGLVVDSLIGEEDVVIKPLRDQYSNSPGIAGATILGDGTVSLILDVSQLLEFGMKSEMNRRIKIETAIQRER